jgi:hypothetical protein
MTNYATFSAWKKFLAGREYQTDNPFDRQPLGTEPVFLHSETTAPLPYGWSRVQKACRLFNSRWASTPTWNFVHKPLRNFNALAKDMISSGSIDQQQKEQIKTLATGTSFDQKAQRKLRTLLKEAVLC